MQKQQTASKRCGVLTQKVGMTRFFEENGMHSPVSLLKLVDTRVLDVRQDRQLENKNIQGRPLAGESIEKKFNVLVAAGAQKKSRLTKQMQGVFDKAQSPPMRKIVSFKVSEDCLPGRGTEISASHFVEGQLVDATAISIGKGFAGAMKRHGFKGLRATHGVSVSHRSMGSTGNREFPGKVFKGKKMPGRMGGKKVTIQNLKVVALDEQQNLILIKGAVPGARGGWVIVRDAIKKPLPEGAPIPIGAKIKGNSENTKQTKAVQVESESTSNASPIQTVTVADATANGGS